MLPAIPPAVPFHSRTTESFSAVSEPRCHAEPGQALALPLPKAPGSFSTLAAAGRGKFFGLMHSSHTVQKHK